MKPEGITHPGAVLTGDKDSHGKAPEVGACVFLGAQKMLDLLSFSCTFRWYAGSVLYLGSDMAATS